MAEGNGQGNEVTTQSPDGLAETLDKEQDKATPHILTPQRWSGEN